MSLINSTSARSDSHEPRGCQRAQTPTQQLFCRQFFMLCSSRDATADSQWESPPHCPLPRLAAPFPIGITTFSPYLKSSARLTNMLFSHANRCLKREGPVGINLVYPGRILAYLKVTGNCTCVHAVICSGTYSMRGPVLNLFYLSQDLGTQKWCPNRGTSVCSLTV